MDQLTACVRQVGKRKKLLPRERFADANKQVNSLLAIKRKNALDEIVPSPEEIIRRSFIDERESTRGKLDSDDDVIQI